MPAYTTVLGLYKPGGGSSGLIVPDEPVDIDKLNNNFDLIDGAVGVGRWSVRPTTPFKNQTGYNTALDTIEQWNGTAWVTAIPNYLQPTKLLGFTKVIPTGASGGTIQANGDVVGVAASAIRLDGVIDWTKYNRYKVTVAAASNSVSGTALYLLGSFGGVPETGTTVWTWLAHKNAAGTGTDSITAATNAGQLTPPFSATAQAASAEAILTKYDITARMQADVIGGVSAGASSAQQSTHLDYASTKDWSTMDGLQIQPGSGTVTMRIAVYAAG